MNFNEHYLTGIPQGVEKYGFCKTLIVRKEIIHLKHIWTEIFIRKSADIQKHLNDIEWDLFRYMEFMTDLTRKIHRFDRSYRNCFDKIVKSDRNSFFRTVELYKGLNNVIVLDFDGVVTSKSFTDLYKLCIERGNVEICSANPTITKDWFHKRNLPLPNKIHSMKGRIKKIKRLIEIRKKYDNVLYVDNETKYLEFAWLFGIHTYHFTDRKIKYFTLKTK